MGETVTKVRETSDVLLGLVAMAIIGVLALIILGNLQGNTGFVADSETINNETTGTEQDGYSLNGTKEITLKAAANSTFIGGVGSVTVYNFTNPGAIVPASNYTVNGSAGTISLIDISPVWNNVSVVYSFSQESTGQKNTDALINNFTTGQVVFFGFSNVWFTLLAVTLLIVIIAGAIILFKPGMKGGFN